MLLHVQYQNYRYDFVDTQTLDSLLEQKQIRGFFRPSEKRWVVVSYDPIRGSGGKYSGPERRRFYDREENHYRTVGIQ